MANLVDIYKGNNLARKIRWIKEDVAKICEKYIGQSDTHATREQMRREIMNRITEIQMENLTPIKVGIDSSTIDIRIPVQSIPLSTGGYGISSGNRNGSTIRYNDNSRNYNVGGGGGGYSSSGSAAVVNRRY